MASLISDTEKTDDQSQLMDLFDTFKRPFTVYLEAEKAIILTNPDYSRFGDNSQNNFNPPVNPTPTTVYGTILYGKEQKYPFLTAGGTDNASTKIRVAEGRTRVKVDSDGYAILKNAKSFVIDEMSFKVVSTPRPHGLFTPMIYTFFLERTQ